MGAGQSRYSDVAGGYSGTGNISSDPLFVDTAHGNFRLQPCSPASDSADHDAVEAAEDPGDLNGDHDFTEPTPFDLDNGDRWVDNDNLANSGNDNGGDYNFADMGAYEYVAPACSIFGDLNEDSEVDGLDIRPFIECVMNSPIFCPCADFNQDNITDYYDVVCFANRLLDEASSCAPNCGSYLLGSPDCNTNGIPDFNDLANGTSLNCNANGVPDECDIDESDPDGNELVSNDVNTNGVPDECELDCNANGVPDAWDISQTTSDDVNTNGVPDECEADCNANEVPDD